MWFKTMVRCVCVCVCVCWWSDGLCARVCHLRMNVGVWYVYGVCMCVHVCICMCVCARSFSCQGP